ncbi:MAG: hypothetical protein HUU02_06390 [Bacteroidetes bacterium]|nr:hypothetical protein [Bacteroidota bacterium]
MRTVLLFLSAISVMLAGCYTELATLEPSDRTVYYESDTVTEGTATTINNHYYLDDEYRRSRLRVSFNYYYPSYSSWIGSYYYSYFNDPYWGMYHRPYWYHDPFAYGWCGWPYYDPWYPYPVVYYPVYYPYPVYYGGPVTVASGTAPSRPRTDGPTRDPGRDERDRPLATPVPTPVVTTNGGPVNEPPAERPRPARPPEKAWWEKEGDERPAETPVNRPSRPTNTTRPSNVNEPRRPAANDPGTGEAAPRPMPRPAANDPKTNDTPSRPVGRPAAPAQVDRPNDAPVYTPPAKKPTQRNDGETARPRESSRPSYTPPAQPSTPPQSAPPRNSGGSNGNGRSRD